MVYGCVPQGITWDTLQGKQAVYAVKRYRGHCTRPLSLFEDLDILD